MKSVEFALTSRSDLFIGKMIFADRYAEDLSRWILLLLPLGLYKTEMVKPGPQPPILRDIVTFIPGLNPGVHISVEEFSRFYSV